MAIVVNVRSPMVFPAVFPMDFQARLRYGSFDCSLSPANSRKVSMSSYCSNFDTDHCNIPKYNLVATFQIVRNNCFHMSRRVVLSCCLWHSLMISMCWETEFSMMMETLLNREFRKMSKLMAHIVACCLK